MEWIAFFKSLDSDAIMFLAMVILSIWFIRVIHRHFSAKDLQPRPCRQCGMTITEYVCPYCGKDQTQNY